MSNNWLPIETAPRDGSILLVSAPHSICVAYWAGESDKRWRNWFKGNRYENVHLGTDAYLPEGIWFEPTHWQKLPTCVGDEALATTEQPTATGGHEGERFYIDCEFDGHNGPLLSIALVAEDGRGVHIEADAKAHDPWVLANVVPLMDQHDATDCTRVAPNAVGDMIRWFIGDCQRPVIVADSPVDIGRFCQAISTGADGGWASADYPLMTFEVHNVDCYPTDLPGAVQHNAWWDAMALRHKLADHRARLSVGEGEGA